MKDIKIRKNVQSLSSKFNAKLQQVNCEKVSILTFSVNTNLYV